MKNFTKPTNSIIRIAVFFLVLFSFQLLSAQQLAFPTALGSGAYATGGRGGTVIHVTNLNSDGPGSFKQAMGQEFPRIIVFDVSGTIDISDLLYLDNGNSNVTIAGQTAPAGGITLVGGRTYFTNVDNLIFRYLRFKGGADTDTVPNSGDNGGNDSSSVVNDMSNQIWDHCTFAFGADEAASWYGTSNDNVVTNLTIQRCFFAESIKGSIIGAKGGGGMSFLSNLFYNAGYRTPNIIGDNMNYDVINNINIQSAGRLINSFGQSNLNHIGNYTDYGSGQIENRKVNLHRFGTIPQIYTTGNKLVATNLGNLTNTISEMNADNKLSWKFHLDGGGFNYGDQLPANYFTDERFALKGEIFTPLTADEAYTDVINDVGCNARLNADGSVSDNLDSLDASWLADIQNGAPYNSKLSTTSYNVPAITSISRPASFYVSNPHIPEVWFNANVPAGEDHNDIAPSGYTWLEQYLNQVDGEIVTTLAESVEVTPDTATLNVPDTITLSTTFTPVNTSNQNGVWVSSDESIATVSSDGTVTSIGEGEVTITFTSNDGGFSDSATITVTNITIDVESITVTPNTLALDLGEVFQANVDFVPANATNKNGTWTSSNPSIASVDDNGNITGLQEGNATITFISSENASLTGDILVTVEDVFFGTYEFYNADTDQLIQLIESDSSFDLNVIGDQVNFRSIPQGGDNNAAVESVQVEWSGIASGQNTESAPLYAGMNSHNDFDFFPYTVIEGTYNFTVTYYSQDNATGNIVAIDTFSLTFFFDTTLVANAGSDQDICEGETITLTASGGTSYLWSTGETTNSIVVSPTATNTYSVTVSNDEGEQDTDEVIVTVNNMPIADAGEDQTICEGEFVTLTASGGTTYLWSTGETTASIEVNPSSDTTYSVEVSSNNCSSTDSVTVFVFSIPNLTVNDDIVIVDGQSTILTANGGTNYLWSTGETTASISVTPTVTTTYTVSSVGANDCSISADVTVTVIPEVIADAGQDATICSGETLTLSASGGSIYLWNTGETTADITISPLVSTTYTVTVEDDYGFTDTDSVTITVNESPNISVSNDVTIMDGDSTTLAANGGDNYLWNTGETTASIVVSPSITTTYTVSSLGVNNCEDTEEVTVTVIPELIANAGEDTAICNGDSITLNATGGIIYTWNTGETGSQLTVSPTVTTTYTVTVEDGLGNSDTDSVTITVNETPNVIVSENITIVEGESTDLNVSGAQTYQWSTGETASSITVSPSQTTTYTVIATANTCSIEAQVTVTVLSVFQASAGEDERVCQNDNNEVVLTANQGDSYLWNTGETTQSIIVNPLATSTYTVTVTQGSQEDTADVTVYVDPNPEVVILNGDTIEILNGEFVTLSASGANSYEWNNGATQPNIAVSPSVTTTYGVTGYIGDCSDDKQVTVKVIPKVIADAGEDVSICLSEVTTLSASGGDEYLWSTGETTQSIQVSPDVTTEYAVTVFNALDFDEDSVIVGVDLDCYGDPSDDPQDFDFDIFPNPASNFVNIRLSGSDILTHVYLYDMTGKLLQSTRISNESMSNSSNTKINIRGLQSGIYYIKLVDINQELTKKLIVK